MCYVKRRFDDRQNYIRAETLTGANGARPAFASNCPDAAFVRGLVGTLILRPT
jgi:hypothetical protein